MGRKSSERKQRKAEKRAKPSRMAEGGIPLPGRKAADPYYRTIMPIQLEMLKLHNHLVDNNERVMVIFEGRHAAGKTAMIKTFSEYMLPKHNATSTWRPAEDNEKTQWYFQRFMADLPHAGQLVFFDRSYYTRAWVESTNATCSPEEAEQADAFISGLEKSLTDAGVKIYKYWLSISAEEQKSRIKAWKGSLVKWKLDHMDLDNPARRDALTAAKEAMFAKTSTDAAPWFVVDANDEKNAQIACMKHFVGSFDYPEKRADLLQAEASPVKRA